MVLVGVHPVFTQVPPNSLRSTIATFIPASLKRPANDGPACPVPTMIASYAFDIKRSFLILLPRVFARFPKVSPCCARSRKRIGRHQLSQVGSILLGRPQ